jgi:hypothetical protein
MVEASWNWECPLHLSCSQGGQHYGYVYSRASHACGAQFFASAAGLPCCMFPFRPSRRYGLDRNAATLLEPRHVTRAGLASSSFQKDQKETQYMTSKLDLFAAASALMKEVPTDVDCARRRLSHRAEAL